MATIFCFTSTGNSLFAAKRIAASINANVLPMNTGISKCDDDIIGFVLPIYFWGLPRIVNRFIEKLEITNKNPYVFAVLTCGGPGFGVLGYIKEMLESKGTRLDYGKSIIFLSNYLPEFNPKDSQSKREKINKKLDKVIRDISMQKSNNPMGTTFINKFGYGLMPNESSDEFFTVADTCTGCETCKKVCPVDNIVMKEGKPSFNHKCEHCIACVHVCPSTAIDLKNRTQGKNRYKNANIPLNELIAFNNHE